MKKILVGSVLALMVAVPAFVLAVETGALGATTTNVVCPLFMPPSPDFCVGGKIVTGEDERGCQRPPQCVRPGALPVRQDIQGIREETRASTTEVRQETRTVVQGQRMDLRSAIASGTANLWSEIRDRMASGTPLSGGEVQAFKDKRGALQEDVQAQIQTFRANVETERQDAQSKIQAARQALKQKLQQFRDDGKKRIVERLAQGLDDLNTKIVGEFSDILDKLDGVVVDISSRADKAEANGKNVSAIRADSASAEEAITAARAAVTTQAGTTYPVNLISEDTARADVTAAKQSLETDLKAVRGLVQTAREAVKSAAQALRKIPGIDSLDFTTSVESQNGAFTP